jgi:hypothetical protein
MSTTSCPPSVSLVDDATADNETVDADLVGLVLPLRGDDAASGLRRRELRVVADDPCDRALTEADDGSVGSEAGDVDTEHTPRAAVGSALLCGEDVAGREQHVLADLREVTEDLRRVAGRRGVLEHPEGDARGSA